MKKVSDTYKELEIDFAFPIEINDVNGNRTYCEERNGYWNKSEYDPKGNQTYYEDSDGYWSKSEYDANGNRTYFEDSDDYWYKRECDDNGKETYFEDNEDYWCRYEYDDNGKETYFEDSKGTKCGTPRSQSCDGKVIEADGKKYNYIIARFWDEDERPTEKESLCVYMYRSGEVQFGTEEEAFKMAKLLSVKKEREYKPYFIDLNQNLNNG